MTIPNQASERLTRLSGKILRLWEERALAEVEAATHQKSLVLHNSLVEFLSQIAGALSTTVNRTEIRIKWDRDESTRVGKKHGRDRAGSMSYTLDQVIFEYQILRQVLCEVMEEESPLTSIEREVIVCAVEQAVNDAATEFSDTLSDIREKFTQTLAHDLLNPIAAAKLNAQLLLRKPGNVDQCIKIATRIAASMERVDLMIYDLLDASKLRAGENLELNFEDFDLDVLLQQIVNEINFIHGDRVKYKTDGETTGHWNEKALRRLVENLMANALKFSMPESPITVKLAHSGKNVEFSIHNFGEPIQAEEKSILFQQYRRARSAKMKMGWGIGLTVVKGLTEAHGGKIDVESSKEAGTTFKITLPWIAPERSIDQSIERSLEQSVTKPLGHLSAPPPADHFSK